MTEYPLVLAGPILRRLEPQRVVIWLACSQAVRVLIRFDLGDGLAHEQAFEPGDPACRHLVAGERLHYLLLDVSPKVPFPFDQWVGYSLVLTPLEGVGQDGCDGYDLAKAAPELCYPGKSTPGFILTQRVASLLHGSCRKPHHPSGDGLVQADRLLARCLAEGQADSVVETDESPAWPAALVLSGDQIYADDVAGPMLRAIHQLSVKLGLPVERLTGTERPELNDADDLYRHPAGFYRRETLLPRHTRNHAIVELLFGGVEKPVFTTDSAHNHLITLAEVLAMYLLVWSPVPWQGLELTPPEGLDAKSAALYADERAAIESFVGDLAAVRRLLAHLPVAMIFDDHDITDDWNLSREWEEIAYGHPFSRRVIGNALIAYALNQAWGNAPESIAGLLDPIQAALSEPGAAAHEDCIDALLRFDAWHYSWPTSPPLVVIDSRTHRWRSEVAARKPSGLMDWEALTDLQQTLRGHSAVLLVSPAPIFGVKLIESIQRVFTWFGQPLMVDAENWMAHPGAAEAILNIFRHPRTPQHFVVLSGDVHYSFVYDVELRGRIRGPDIWQICSSGLRNEFPPRLLDALDRANRWLYSPRSPLNGFTRRRHMRVIPRKPEGIPHGRRLLNGSGIGLVELDPSGVPWRIRQLLADGRVVRFTRREAESRWD